MIGLCSNNKNVIKRWNEILGKAYKQVTHLTLSDLENLPDNIYEAIILHEALFPENSTDQIKTLIKKYEASRFLILSDRPDEQTAFRIIHSGAYGYSNTYISPKLLCDAVKQVLNGDVWMGKRLTRYLSECLLEDINDEDTEDTAIDVETMITRLTSREIEVAKRVAHGCTNKCIANKLFITERTVKAHLSSIFEKTGLKDRVHLALILNTHKYD